MGHWLWHWLAAERQRVPIPHPPTSTARTTALQSHSANATKPRLHACKPKHAAWRPKLTAIHTTNPPPKHRFSWRPTTAYMHSGCIVSTRRSTSSRRHITPTLTIRSCGIPTPTRAGAWGSEHGDGDSAGGTGRGMIRGIMTHGMDTAGGTVIIMVGGMDGGTTTIIIRDPITTGITIVAHRSTHPGAREHCAP